jgi:hypothetical protein
MAWREWVRATAIRLGIAEPGSVPVENALDHLVNLEERLVALRTSLISEAAGRALYVEEVTAFNSARANLYAATKALYLDLIRIGMSSSDLPIVSMLAPLPANAVSAAIAAPSATAFGALEDDDCGCGYTGRRYGAPFPRSASLGAIKVGPGVTPLSTRGGEWAGTLGSGSLGYGPIAAAVGWGLLALGIIGASAALGWVLVDLINPEVALQEAITERDISLAEATAQMASEWEETRRTAIEQGIDPNTLDPPIIPDLNELATGNPLVTTSAVKGIVAGLAVLGALFVGYKIWQGRE